MQTGFSLANQTIALSRSYIWCHFASQRQLYLEKCLAGKEKKCSHLSWLSHWVWSRDTWPSEFIVNLCCHWEWERGSFSSTALLSHPILLCCASMSVSGKAWMVPWPGIRTQLSAAEESHPDACLLSPHCPNETQKSDVNFVVAVFSNNQFNFFPYFLFKGQQRTLRAAAACATWLRASS